MEVGDRPYSILECSHLFIRKGVGFGNDWDQVDLGMKPAHDFNVQWLQRVASGLNEIDTGMDSIIDNVHAVDLVLRFQVRIVSLFDVFHDWAPRVVIVDEVSETGSVNHGQTQAHAILLNIGAD